MSFATLEFNKQHYSFKNILHNLFRKHIDDSHIHHMSLDLIHRFLNEQHNLFTEVGKDSATILHKLYYKYCNVGSRFHDEYVNFVNAEIPELFTCSNILQKKHKTIPFLYQTLPTFRVHLPDNVAVARFHKDRDYNHNTWETNICIPMTTCEGNNAIWIESEEDKGDFESMEADYGQYLVFDGANLQHGNKLNDTHRTRISIDFRILPLDKYIENDKTSVSVNTKMNIGGYWSLYEENLSS